jgi:predicted NBD/HSP70 family sugar kinase
MPSGFAAETTARLVADALVAEAPAEPTGGRGRPTTLVGPHPDGPLVAVACVAHETWQVAAVEIGGAVVAVTEAVHQRQERAVLAALARELRRLARRFGPRLLAQAVSVPGTVAGTRLVYAANLDWHDVDLTRIAVAGLPLVAGNDATFSGLGEARRGAARGAKTALHLLMDAGVGGTVIEGGQPAGGFSGMAGEYGHLPFADPAQRCRCGAPGCWNTAIDGRALAQALGVEEPDDEVSFTRSVLEEAATGGGSQRALAALRRLGHSLGRGIAGLVNAVDPEVVTLGGLAPLVLDVAGPALEEAYRQGLMRYRATPPPALRRAELGPSGPLVGAAEAAFDRVFTAEGLRRWSARQGGADRRSLGA